MGNDYSKEHDSTWDDSDVGKWKKKAAEDLRLFYLAFGGQMWDEYDEKNDQPLLRAKICFALFGMPTEDAEMIENAYTAKQKKAAEKIAKKIVKVYRKSRARKLRVSVIFVACKKEEKEFMLPIFAVSTNDDPYSYSRKFVDMQCRVYDSWTDWKKNNRLPMLKYAYPTCGYYSCKENEFLFDPERKPVVEYNKSPACKVSSRIARQADLGSGITSVAGGVIGLIALFTPVIGPALLATTVVAGSVAASYGFGRSIARIHDKRTHGESLVDLESWMLWVGIAATPLNFVTFAANGILVAGARQGRIFSSTARMCATVLNCTRVGVDGVMVAFGLANLINKGIHNQLTPLDFLQFSLSIFFFTHAVIQPITAKAIITKAQNQHISKFKNKMSDSDAKAAFDKFLETNKGANTMNDKSKIIRTINRMDDPNGFFKKVGKSTAIIQSDSGDCVEITSKKLHFFKSVEKVDPNEYTRKMRQSTSIDHISAVR